MEGKSEIYFEPFEFLLDVKYVVQYEPVFIQQRESQVRYHLGGYQYADL